MMEILKGIEKKQKVYNASHSLTENDFEPAYIALRKKENRLYTDDIVKQLPNGKKTSQPGEWKMRSKSAKRVMDYFQKRQNSNILDLGCGNGWFTAILTNSCNCEVIGVDLNLIELKQAARVFSKPNLDFVYADIFEWPKTDGLFDFVTINATIQYFPDFGKLMDRLFKLLKNGGEVHIIDSPFYKTEEVEAARNRSRKYYSEMGFEKMGENYFHHAYGDLEGFDFEIIYNPEKNSMFNKVFKSREIPFPWIRVRK